MKFGFDVKKIEPDSLGFLLLEFFKFFGMDFDNMAMGLSPKLDTDTEKNGVLFYIGVMNLPTIMQPP